MTRLRKVASARQARRRGAKRNPVSAETVSSYNKLKRKSTPTLKAIISGLGKEKFKSRLDQSDLNAAKRILRERQAKPKKRKPRKKGHSTVKQHYRKKSGPRNKSGAPARQARRTTIVVKKNPYEEWAIVGYFWHKAETKFYWTGVNWSTSKKTAIVYRYREEAWSVARRLRTSWKMRYPQLRHIKVEKIV